MAKKTSVTFVLLIISNFISFCMAYNVLLATMGGTKSHTVPFVALGTALRSRGHNVTLVSAFSGPAANNDLQELVPSILEIILSMLIVKTRNCSSHTKYDYTLAEPYQITMKLPVSHYGSTDGFCHLIYSRISIITVIPPSTGEGSWWVHGGFTVGSRWVERQKPIGGSNGGLTVSARAIMTKGLSGFNNHLLFCNMPNTDNTVVSRTAKNLNLFIGSKDRKHLRHFFNGAYVGNYTAEWDLVGSRFRNELPLSPWDAMRYGWEACEALLRDETSVSGIKRPYGNPRARWDVAVLDGAYPECLLGILHSENVPIMMLNTVAMYTGSIARQGNPSLWSITPYFGKGLTQDMSFPQRIVNAACLATLEVMHWIMTTGYIQPTLRKYLGDDVPDVRELISEVPLTLQNSHYAVADSVPYLSNVVNVACLHCHTAMQLSPDLESFLRRGFVYVSMGSSVRASGMPDALREMFVAAFATLPYNIVWKWEGGKIEGLPGNVRTAAWWPQQELLGHPHLQAFVSHGGLLSLHEAAFHGSPTLVLPVFCDHDGNAAQAEKLGYALVMDLSSISVNGLRQGILTVASGRENQYREAAVRRSNLLKEQPIGPRELAIWWVEHVAKHRGAEHLKNTARNMGVLRYYSLDVAAFYISVFTGLLWLFGKWPIRVTMGRSLLKKKID